MTGRYRPVNVDLQISPAMLVSDTTNTALQSVAHASPSYSHQAATKRVRTLLQRKPYRGKLLGGALASIVSLVTILVLLALCRISQRKLHSGAAARRSLSDMQDDEERSDILERCLDLEEELGLGVATSAHAEDAREAKARLVAILYESAAVFERIQALPSQRLQGEVQLSAPKFPGLNDPWPSTPHPQASAREISAYLSGVKIGAEADAFDENAWLITDYMAFSGDVQQQGQMEKVSGVLGIQHDVSAPKGLPYAFENAGTGALPAALPFGGANSGEVALTADALRKYTLAPMISEASQEIAMGSVGRQPIEQAMPTTYTSSGYMGTTTAPAGRPDRVDPGADMGQASAMLSSEMELFQPLEQRADASSPTSTLLERLASATNVRPASSQGGEPCEARDIDLHPFVRLPVVNPQILRTDFTELVGRSLSVRTDSPMTAYMAMRDIFAKSSLTAEDVSTLMAEAEVLVKYATMKLARPCRRSTPSYVLMRLSSLFMVFDHLVCIIEILGGKMIAADWWKDFACKFQTDYTFRENARMKRTRMLIKFANRLSAALLIYKEGKRPPFIEIIELKRAILNMAIKDSQLANPLWKLWLQDDREFCFPSGGLKDHSGGKAQGQQGKKAL